MTWPYIFLVTLYMCCAEAYARGTTWQQNLLLMQIVPPRGQNWNQWNLLLEFSFQLERY